MERLRYDNPEQMIDWARPRIGINFRPDATAIGWLSQEGALMAVVVFDSFSECDCNMHVASDGSRRWLTRGYLRALFAYPFMQLQQRRVTALVASKNRASLRLCLGLGFRIEGLCRHAMPDDDVAVLGMLRSKCAFIPPEYRHD